MQPFHSLADGHAISNQLRSNNSTSIVPTAHLKLQINTLMSITLAITRLVLLITRLVLAEIKCLQYKLYSVGCCNFDMMSNTALDYNSSHMKSRMAFGLTYQKYLL